MKIVIVGGGIAGLSTYLHLLKFLPNLSEHSITIFESHRLRPSATSDSPDVQEQPALSLEDLSFSTALVGGGVGISPNGTGLLRRLDPELHARFVAQGFSVENFVFKGANGWTLGMQNTSNKKVIPDAKDEEICIASSRHGLWETLLRFVEEKQRKSGSQESVVRYVKVQGVERDPSGDLLHVRYIDEQGEEQVVDADLVIGADGVKSVVRKALFDPENKQFQPVYTGLSGVGGFLDAPIPSYITDNRAMVFTFGGNGFFGYSSGAPPASQKLMWWSTYETANLPSGEPVDPATIKAALLKRHAKWQDPIIHDIINQAEVQSIYPTWTLDTLPHWGENGIVLLGDAAHAMDPTTGQGASQAMEDGETFAIALAKILERNGIDQSERDSIDQAIKMFHDIRAPRVKKIVDRGKKMSGRKADVGIIAEYFMYGFMWMLTHLPSIGKMIIGDVYTELYCWSAEEEVEKALKKQEGK